MDPKIADVFDNLIKDLKNCKYSLEMLLWTLGENESRISGNTLDWSKFLNSLTVISTNLITISRFLKDRKELLIKTSIIVPKHFSEDVDQSLQELTNHRISVFNQDVIPFTMRTKLIPALEEDETKIYQSGRELEQFKTTEDNVNYFKKAINLSSNLFEKPKRDLDGKLSSGIITYNVNDTWQLANLIVNLNSNSSKSFH